MYGIYYHLRHKLDIDFSFVLYVMTQNRKVRA